MNKGLTLLPPAPDVCQECAVKHDPNEPHNQQSLFYQYHFYFQHGRWPTWTDAIVHCDEQIRQFWIKELATFGITIETPLQRANEQLPQPVETVKRSAKNRKKKRER